MRSIGAITGLVSGGFMPLAERIGRDVGFEVVEANRLEVANGRLTGRVIAPIVGPEAKLAMLERLRAQHGIRAMQTLAVGDGANDLPMLLAAGLGVAYHAHARWSRTRRRWRSRIRRDLRALLFSAGYRETRFRLHLG